jgi:anti-sigma28 factor (negative regulator of flagellin synthesis)/hypoxanthine phosphoribosyltransferase
MERGPLGEADIDFSHHPDKKNKGNHHKKGKPTEEELEAEEDAQEVAESIKRSLEKILKQLKEQILQGDYSLVLGDDCSGRIPAEIIFQTIKMIYEKKGYEEPKITFVTSTGYDPDGGHSEAVAKHLEKFGYKPEEGKRALVVTESMSSGESVKVLTKALEELGFDWDVATLNNYKHWDNDEDKGFWERFLEKFRKKEESGSHRIIEGIPDSQRYVIDRHDLAGVEKQYSDTEDEPVVSQRTPEDDQDYVNAMREAIDELSGELAQKFLDAA